MPLAHPGPAYLIRTRRMVLRCWDPHDASLMKEAIDASIEHLRPWMPWAWEEPTEMQAKVERLRRMRGRFDLGEDFVYGVFSPDEREVWGGTGMHARIGEGALEIGYWVRVDRIGQGLATEFSAALTRAGFEVYGMRRMEIHCDPANVRSAAVPRKLGYTHEATLPKRVPFGEQSPRDSMVWALHKEAYPASPSARAEIECYDAAGRRIL